MSSSEACRVVPCTNELILCLLCIAVTSIMGNSEYTGENQYCEVIYYTVKDLIKQTRAVHSFDNNCSLLS